MSTMIKADLEPQLREWRTRLAAVVSQEGEGEHLAPLLKEIDSALDRIERRTYGVCTICREVMDDSVAADPLARFCLSHLTAAEARALERDLGELPEIQCELLPKHNVQFDGWEVAYHYQPLGTVSGDYIDLQILNGGELFFLVGDVSGKGVAASMLMAHLHATFRSLLTVGLSVSELVERANNIFCGSTMTAYFATLVCGKADASGEVEFVNAGHCPPLLLRRGEISSIETTGMPVGMFCDARYTSERIRLDAGDRLLLYTDGLTEARDPLGMEYGTERLSGLLREHPAPCSQTLISACLDDLGGFLSGTPLADDLTVMTLRRLK